MKPSDVETPQDIIARHCVQSNSSTVTLYRGVLPGESEAEYYIGTIRQDRRPRSSSPESVAIFDKLMELNGWGFRKSNTLSTAQQADIASRYGMVYQVYPFDGAFYLGSTKYEDFISIPMKIKTMHRGYNSRDLTPTFEWMRQNLDHLNTITGLFASHSLEDMQPAVGEILILGTKYVGLRKPKMDSDHWGMGKHF